MTALEIILAYLCYSFMIVYLEEKFHYDNNLIWIFLKLITIAAWPVIFYVGKVYSFFQTHSPSEVLNMVLPDWKIVNKLHANYLFFVNKKSLAHRRANGQSIDKILDDSKFFLKRAGYNGTVVYAFLKKAKDFLEGLEKSAIKLNEPKVTGKLL